MDIPEVSDFTDVPWGFREFKKRFRDFMCVPVGFQGISGALPENSFGFRGSHGAYQAASGRLRGVSGAFQVFREDSRVSGCSMRFQDVPRIFRSDPEVFKGFLKRSMGLQVVSVRCRGP